MKTVTALRLQRLGKHRVLLSWKAQRGARRYQVLRAGKSGHLLAVVRKAQYVDAKAPPGKLTTEALRGAGRPVVLNVRRA